MCSAHISFHRSKRITNPPSASKGAGKCRPTIWPEGGKREIFDEWHSRLAIRGSNRDTSTPIPVKFLNSEDEEEDVSGF